ncbi:hypothetical protein [Jeotgalibacillus salarius]|uniref:Uncharacterized protein n=1 Tax=Jeotgalibacillus salarius TaxID=546023 RepID=A0A4Y8LIK8_9BACL|nr:hypothetical protein [Jeotgalibacillus salarius]TFE02860.1 hypothetical protein E2626_03370 [Jeotgalibacillus salarius]
MENYRERTLNLRRKALWLHNKVEDCRTWRKSPKYFRRMMRLTNYKKALIDRMKSHIGPEGRV